MQNVDYLTSEAHEMKKNKLKIIKAFVDSDPLHPSTKQSQT